MLTLRDMSKRTTLGALSGAAVGSSAGALGAYIGLNQACALETTPKADCNAFVSENLANTMAMGASLGASIGFGVGAFFTVSYDAIVNRCRRPTQESPYVERELQGEEVDVERKESVSLK